MLFNFQGASRYRFSRQLCYYIKLKTLCQYFFQTFFKFFEVFSKSFRSSQLSARLRPSVLCLTSSACLLYTTASPLSTPFFKVFPLFLTFYLFVIITQLGYPPIVHFTHIHIKYAKKRASQCARLSILHYYIGIKLITSRNAQRGFRE